MSGTTGHGQQRDGFVPRINTGSTSPCRRDPTEQLTQA